MLGLKVDDEIELRLFQEKDADDIFAAVTANFEHLRPFLHWVKPDYALETAKEFIAQNQKSSVERKSEAYGIFYQSKFAGSVGFVKFQWDSRLAEIGYWLAKNFEGKGIITKSCKALISYAFDKLEMNRIEIRCATVNTKSRAIPERLGFQLEGVLRQSLWRHTRFYDMAIYGILAEEWRR
jgi:ribosomal-protein-serine acetyltransferase